MSLTLEVTGHNAALKIEVQDYENRTASNASDANWLQCLVRVDIPPFAGTFPVSFTTHDFRSFADALAPALRECNGKAEFQTDEDELAFRVQFQEAGRATVSGTAKIQGQIKATLGFTFESDQSFLQKTLADLQEILAQYPIKS